MDITDIKAQNIKKILNVLQTSSGTTKNEIAATTGLSFSTVSNLCNELKDNGVLIEEKMSNFSVGRIPRNQIFRREGFGSVCIDLQQEGIFNYSILNFANERLCKASFDISEIRDVSCLLDLIETTYANTIRQAEGTRIAGAGVSIAGIFDEASSLVINTSTPLLNNLPLRDMLEQRLGLPCYVENESNLCALSIRQDHPTEQNIVYLHSSAGLGVGVICGGVLLRGKNGYAAEVSHIPIGDPTVVCPYCGSTGCIESDLSQKGMEILKDPSIDAGERTRLIEDRGTKLGNLLSILVNLFDPSVICVGGQGFWAYDDMEPYVQQVLERRSHLSMSKGLQVIYDRNSLNAIEKGVTQIIYNHWDPLQK